MVMAIVSQSRRAFYRPAEPDERPAGEPGIGRVPGTIVETNGEVYATYQVRLIPAILNGIAPVVLCVLARTARGRIGLQNEALGVSLPSKSRSEL